MTTRTHTAGSFCWFNLLTPQAAAAREFFAALLGWTYTEMPGVGHTVQVADVEIGTLFDLSASGALDATPPHVGVTLRVDNTEAACRRVNALGGRASPAFDLMDQGRMAVCVDPGGAEFDIWEPKQRQKSEFEGRVHGAPGWFELTTSDSERTAVFYAGLFGWTSTSAGPSGSHYTLFNQGDTCVAGMSRNRSPMALTQAHWAAFFHVRDVESTLRKALELGATQTTPIVEVPGVGRFCSLTSPQGLEFRVMTCAG